MIAILAAALALTVTPNQTAVADWQAHGQDPNIRYLNFHGQRRDHLKDWDSTVKFAVVSASRTELIDHHIPVRLKGTAVYRIHLDRLQWDRNQWLKVLEKYPYGGNNPLVLNGPWLVNELADPRDSDALYRLLYGEAAPKTDEDFLKFWGVDPGQQTGQHFGWAESHSQVSKQGNRFIERFNARGLSLWRTKDMNAVNAESDPLEHLDGNIKHDGRELIAQFMKTSLARGARGAAQAYLLANAEGKVVQEAPVRLVEDYKRTLGQSAIINNASCISCHENGMQMPSENGLAAYLRAGVRLYAYDQGKQEEIESFHLTDVVRQLERDNENYAIFVKCCNGLTPAANAIAYRQSLKRYVNDLELSDAARELYIDAEELRLALGWAGANSIEIGSRLAGLAHGRTIPRDQFEQDYPRALAMLNTWAAVTKKQ